MTHAQYDHRKLGVKLGVVVAAAAIVLSTGAAYADLGDQLAKLLAEDGAGGDQFGISIAIEDGIVAVGARLDDDNGENSGSAYLFDVSTGAQIAKLLPGDGAEFDWFGEFIAIDNGVVAVAARLHDHNGEDSGSVYLFNASTGTQIAELLAVDGAAFDQFGKSIAIDNGVVAIGAHSDVDNGFNSGSAYLFDASTGKQLFKLLPSDGAVEDRFGNSIAIDNGVVAIGARGDDNNGLDSGSAYLFNASTGAQIAKLLTSDGMAGDWFGWSIAIRNGIVAVGARLDDETGLDSGSAYLFNISDPMNPVQVAKLLPSDGAEEDEFGWSIAIDNGIVTVGARRDDDNGLDSGSAYLFDISDPKNPVQIAKLLPSDGAAEDQFGYWIAIDNGVVAIGAYRDDDNGDNSGSAYLFSATEIEFDPPEEFPAFGEATVEAIGSFDAIDNDTQDVAVIIPGVDPEAIGNVQVFLNLGNDKKSGDWNGLDGGEERDLIPVGKMPSNITAGFFNDDTFIDLAVSNAGDDQLSILLGDGNGSFIPGPPQDVGQVPSAVASAQFDMDGHVDLVVANALDNTVWVLFGDGLGGFNKGPMLPTEGTIPLDADPGDLDNDRDLDIVGLNNIELGVGKQLNGSVFVILNDGDGNFAKAVNYPVGIDPRQLAIADVDGDTFNDVVVVNGADATVSVLLNQGDGTFGPAIEIGVGTTPRSIDTADLDGDGDPDLVIAADNEAMEPVVQVLANITSGPGEAEFDLPLEFSVNADPNFVAIADFDVNGFLDIVTANTDDGDTSGSVSVLLSDPPCPWDLDADGSVGASDLLSLLISWGPCDGCSADFDGNGSVGATDLRTLLVNWGPCP